MEILSPLPQLDHFDVRYKWRLAMGVGFGFFAGPSGGQGLWYVLYLVSSEAQSESGKDLVMAPNIWEGHSLVVIVPPRKISEEVLVGF